MLVFCQKMNFFDKFFALQKWHITAGHIAAASLIYFCNLLRKKRHLNAFYRRLNAAFALQTALQS